MTKALPLIGRILFAFLFIGSGLGKIFNFAGVQGFMEGAGIPAAALLLVIAIIVEIAGGLSLLIGYKAKWGGWLLLIYMVIVTAIFHLNLGDQQQFIQFSKNLAIIGGLLFVIHFGAGPMAMDK